MKILLLIPCLFSVMAVQTETGDVLEDELKVLQRSESIVKDVKLQLKMSS